MTIVAANTGPLIAGASGVLVWLIGLSFAIKLRRVLFTLAAILAVVTTIIRALTDAHAHVAPWLADSVVYWGKILPALLVVSFVASHYPTGRRHGWRL